MAKKKRKIDSFSADELLEELRRREMSPTKNRSASLLAASGDIDVSLTQYSSAVLAKALREAQKVVYGVDDRMDDFEIILSIFCCSFKSAMCFLSHK